MAQVILVEIDVIGEQVLIISQAFE